MNWTTIRRGLTVAGIIWVVALIPASIRPTWKAAPFQKGNQTITVVQPARGVMPADYRARVKKACLAPSLLRPVEAAARSVRVIVVFNGQPIEARDLNCAAWTS